MDKKHVYISRQDETTAKPKNLRCNVSGKNRIHDRLMVIEYVSKISALRQSLLIKDLRTVLFADLADNDLLGCIAVVGVNRGKNTPKWKRHIASTRT
jgi:hypothetical protein